MRQHKQMTDMENEEPDWDEVVAIMHEARAKSRSYATYWEWAPERSQAEVGVAQALADFLMHSDGRSWASVQPIADDPPDVLLLCTSGNRVGVEVTELVDEATVERHRYHKKVDTYPPHEWADWTVDSLASSIVQAIERKDRKLAARAGQYDELIVAVATDEPMISLALAEQALRMCSARVHNLQRAFLLLSYQPEADKRTFPQGVPVLSIPLQRA